MHFNFTTMLSEEEKLFLAYWEQNRARQKKIFYQLLVGLPLGLLIALPILLNYMLGWNKRATMVGNAQYNPLVLIVAVLAIAVFFFIFKLLLYVFLTMLIRLVYSRIFWEG